MHACITIFINAPYPTQNRHGARTRPGCGTRNLVIQARGPRPSPRCALYVDAMIAAMPASPWMVLARIIRLACRQVTHASHADACHAECCMCDE